MTVIARYNENIQWLFIQKEIHKKIHDDSQADIPPFCSMENKNGKLIWKMDLSETPLIFKIQSHDVLSEIEILIKFEAEEIDEKLQMNKYGVNIRLWSDKSDYCYREPFDSLRIKTLVDEGEWKRVMIRFHLEQKEPNVTLPEPLCHLNFGGKQSPDEHCWIPTTIREPRFPHPPMDIVLLLEYFLVNYYPNDSQDFRNKREWIDIVRFSQKLFQEKYFEACQSWLKNDENTYYGHQCSIC
jgi:hypothetical protein